MSPEARKPRRRTPDRARRLAFDALRLVHTDDAYANLVTSKLISERGLTGRDASFATELVFGTARHEGQYDLIIAAAAGRELKSFQPAVVDILRLGTHQLLELGTPARAAVDSSVDLAAATVGERVTGLVNAVLRKVAAHDRETWLERLCADSDLDAEQRLAIQTAHPRWIVAALADRLPAEELEAALKADNVNPVVTLAVRPGLAELSELLDAGAKPGRWSPYAATWQGNPADLESIRSGRAGVQDEGSQLVAIALSRASAPDGDWLDLCAGPGGKTALLTGLAGLAGAGGASASRPPTVLAAEVSPHRAELVAKAVRAFPAERVEVVVADGTNPPWPTSSFARVIADVPCSGLGALRRRPDSRWRRDTADVEGLHPLQVQLLESALASARPGGVVAYVTCSPHRRETIDVVAEVLASRPEIEVIDAAELLPEVPNATDGPYLQLWPHRHGADAMFAAYLRVPA